MLKNNSPQRHRGTEKSLEQFPPHLGGGLGWGCSLNIFDNKVNNSPPSQPSPFEGEGESMLKVFSVPLCLCGEGFKSHGEAFRFNGTSNE